MSSRLGLVSATSATALLLWVLAPAWSEELRHDFRGGCFNDELFRYEGPTPEAFINPEDEGLRFHFTAAKAPGRPVGIYWRFQVRGDFNATAHYEILQEERPRQGYGAGVEMYLMLANAARDGIAFARLMRPEGGPALAFFHLTDSDGGKRITKESQVFPTTARSRRGRMRLARQGPTLIVSFAEGDAEDFQELHRTDIGASDVRMVRFAGVSGGDANVSLDARLSEFDLQSQEWGHNGKFSTTLPPDVAPVPSGRKGWLWGGLGVVVLVCAGGVFLFYWRTAQTKAPARDKGAKPPLGKPSRRAPALETSVRSALPAAAPKALASGPAVVPCPHCRKRLRIPASAVGKRVQCPACALPFVG
jgi:hypothetical protein